MAEPDTIVVRTSGVDDATRVAPLMEQTERVDVLAQDDTFAIDDALLADRYEMKDLLGRGATGAVYRGRDRILGRDVAIKLLYPDLANDTETSARFQQEAQLAARVNHPHAVAIFDTGVHDGQPFIVMECLSGETLASRIAAQPLPIDQVRDIGAQLLGALDAAHREGVIHRDIKPGNLLLTSTGSVKVADFGIATAADRGNLTSTGFVVGTLAYLAPERLTGAPATAQSDIYAAGVVLYEALTGCKPSEGDALEAIVSLRPDVDPRLARVVARALQRDPQARYPTAAAMAHALAKSRTKQPRSSLAPPSSPEATVVLESVSSGDRRPRRVVAVAMALAATAALVGAAFATRSDRFPIPSATTTQVATVGDGEATGPANSVVPTPSTAAVSTTVRPATTRPTVTTAPDRTPRPKGKPKG